MLIRSIVEAATDMTRVAPGYDRNVDHTLTVMHGLYILLRITVVCVYVVLI